MRLDGFLAPATGEPSFSMLCLHGVGANFYNSSTLESLIPGLRALGVEVLLANTRGHDLVYTGNLGTTRRRLGAAYESVADCRNDIAAWLRYFQEQGRQRILLLGHSLGAIKAVYSQAHEPAAEVMAIVAVSPPRLSQQAFLHAEHNGDYLVSLREAEKLVAQNRGDELFTARFPFPLLITAAGYLDKYGPGERYNILKLADRLSIPSLFVYGGKELVEGGVAFNGVPEALENLPQPAPRSVAVVPGADHVYSGCFPLLSEVVCEWLAKLNQSPPTAASRLHV